MVMGLVRGIVVHLVFDDVPAIAGSVIGASVGDVDLSFDFEMVLHLRNTSSGRVGRVTTFDARGSIDHALFDLASTDRGPSTHITAVGHAVDLDVAWSLARHVEGHDIGFSFGAIRVLGSDFEVVFAKENVLKADVFGGASRDEEAIAKVALLTKGHGISMDGLSFWGSEIPRELGWERIAVPLLSAWKLGYWIVHILASVLKIGFLSGSMDFLSSIEIGRDCKSVSGVLRCGCTALSVRGWLAFTFSRASLSD